MVVAGRQRLSTITHVQVTPDRVMILTIPTHSAAYDAQMADRIQTLDEVMASNGGRPLMIFTIADTGTNEDRMVALLGSKAALLADLDADATFTFIPHVTAAIEHTDAN